MRSLFVSFVLVVGCTSSYPDGRYSCSTADPTCPPGLTCFGTRCYHAAPDGSAGDDGGGDTGAPSDAGCGAIGCATIRATNAWSGGPMLPVFTLNGVPFPALNFGETSPDIVVPLTEPDHLQLMITDFGTMPVTLPSGAARYTVVISEGNAASPMMPTTTILENNFAGTSTTTTLRFASVIHGGGSFEVDHGATMGTITDFARLTMDTLGAAADEPIQLLAGDEPLAAFSTAPTDLPRAPGGGYYVVFAGRTDHALVAGDGLRMILCTPGVHLRQSIPLVWFLNATTQQLDVCRAGTTGLVATVDPGLAGPFAPDPGSGAFAVALTSSGTPCAAGGTFFSFPALTPGPQRFLAMAAADAVTPTTLHTILAVEPPNPNLQTPAAQQAILFATALPTLASLGRWDGSAFTALTGTQMLTTDDIGTAFTGAPEASIAMRVLASPAVTYEYEWDQAPSAAPIEFALAARGGAMPSLWTVSAPYGATWRALERAPTAMH